MNLVESLSLFQLVIALAILLGSIALAFRVHRDAPDILRRDIRKVITLVFFIFAGYLFLTFIFFGNVDYPLHSITSSTLLGAACLIYFGIMYIMSFSKYVKEKDGEIVSYRSQLTERTESLEVAVKERVKAEERVREYQGHLEEESLVRRRTEEQIAILAYYDSLTNLPNRLLFLDRLTQALEHARRHERLVAVLFLDLDNFKRINDNLGHAVGDKLLKGVAERLARCLRKSDSVSYWADEGPGCVSRLGGDEFVIFLNEVAKPEAAAFVAERILESVSQPYALAGQEIFITVSIGITIYPNHGQDASGLLRNADMAMYQAKEQGRNNFQFYNQEMNATGVERLALENSLRAALRRDEFLLYYQPQVDMRTGKVVCMEALVRWRHQKRGLVSPSEFIPIAEENGLIVPIGEWVLRNACMESMKWQADGHPDVRVAVNLSSYQFRQRGLVEAIEKAVIDYGLDPARIEVELTESIIMRDAEETIATLKRLKAMGIAVSIDDFGTGYSSLSYLKRFPIDTLKIDASFVRDIANDADSAAITKTIIAMAHNLNLRVVAEGVETVEQRDFLQDNGCDVMQGFLFCQPVPAEQTPGVLSRETWM